jgi:very-short-patch-repair endonuclease
VAQAAPAIPQHLESVGDKIRDHWLEAEGFRVLRFWNHEVLNDVEAVLAAISAAVQRLRCPASP